MLRVLMLRKKINDKKKELEKILANETELAQREADLTSAIEEAATEEERSVVEESITAFESEKAANDEQKGALEREIGEMETELAGLEEAQDAGDQRGTDEIPQEEKRSEVNEMNRVKFFGMSAQERDAFVAREDVKNFLGAIRTAIQEKRALSGVQYLIPDVMLDLLRENVIQYSKLYKHVNVQRLNGTGRMDIEGTIPEAVWTEMCANLNELDLSFTQITVDGYKVGGYFKICNAILQDSMIDLAREVLDVLGRAIGLALDKAILYGTGTKMPQGIVTALAGVSGTPNIVSHAASVVDMALWKAIVGDSGLANSDYARGEKVWVMNEKTRMTLIQNALAVNAAGAIVAGVDGVMPVIGGVIEVLNFVPDNTIIGGYFDLYLLAERRGIELATSEHAFFLADQTAFKGTARYDGKVVKADAFVVIGLNGVTPAANAVTFAADTANTGE